MRLGNLLGFNRLGFYCKISEPCSYRPIVRSINMWGCKKLPNYPLVLISNLTVNLIKEADFSSSALFYLPFCTSNPVVWDKIMRVWGPMIGDFWTKRSLLLVCIRYEKGSIVILKQIDLIGGPQLIRVTHLGSNQHVKTQLFRSFDLIQISLGYISKQ